MDRPQQAYSIGVYEASKPAGRGFGEDGLAIHAICKVYLIDNLPGSLVLQLNILQDTYEGLLPPESRREMREEGQEIKSWFNTRSFHRQIDAWPDQNENDGRELLVVNCWFLGERPSERMWSEYGGSHDAVAIKSTIGRLANNVSCLVMSTVPT